MRKLSYVAAATALLLSFAADAGHRRPGLWQITIQSNFTKGGPQIPPDQLAKMQQLGMKIPGMGGGPQTMQMCLTPEQAAKDDNPDPGRGDCQVLNKTWSGDHFSGDLVCHGREGDMHGHIDAVASGDTSYTATSHIEGNNPHLGGDFAMDGQSSGQWQSADCGSVKPFPQRD